MEILHTTGIHKQGVDQKKVKKVRKKGSTFCPPEKVSLEGSPFFNFFFNRGKTGNIQMLASWYKTYIQRFGEDAKKGGGEVSCNHRPYCVTLAFVLFFEEFLIHDSHGFMILKNH